jgi:hypothetical protein
MSSTSRCPFVRFHSSWMNHPLGILLSRRTLLLLHIERIAFSNVPLFSRAHFGTLKNLMLSM